MLAPIVIALLGAGPEADAADLETKVQTLFDDACVSCHDAEDDFDMEVDPHAHVGAVSKQSGMLLIAPGNPDDSYLFRKMLETAERKGDVMPPDGALGAGQLDTVRAWIVSLGEDEPSPAPAPVERSSADENPADRATQDAPTKPAASTPPASNKPNKQRLPKPFHGTHQVVLPTTTTLGKRSLQFRIDHRFGRIGEERGAFGLDAAAVISIGLAYGIVDGWDLLVRRTNARKGYELGSKYVPVRQEAGMPVSFGLYGSLEYYNDFHANLANPWSGNFMAMLSRLWWSRWTTMLTVGYHLRTNHAPRVFVDLGDGPVKIHDRRDTLTVALASTVWLGERKRWGIDLEWLLPIPDGGSPRNAFYYRGGDADPDGTKIGGWAIGGSYYTGKHLFQVFLTNNREIHTGLAAPGGQTGNPFPAGERPNFFLGFNLARRFAL